MQKRIFTFLFLIATVLSYSTFAEAALQFLPRYQGGYGSRTQQGGKDKVCDSIYQYACSGTGYAGGIGTSCNDLYTSCSCSTNYKWSGGSCVLKSCSDYGYSASKDNTKSCEEKTPRSGLTCYVCTACDSSTYKYACSGGLNASTQGTSNKCGMNYSECSCVEHANWNSSSGKCECGSDYKAGTTSCTLKTCEDYGYSATEDTTKDCTKQTPRSGLACWNCSACTGTLYDCSSMANVSGADTSSASCGGKYAKCKCKDLYVWDNGVCKLGCTRNSCSTTTYPLTAQNAANASSYEKCTPSCSDESPRYKVAGCNSGYVPQSGTSCKQCAAGTYNSSGTGSCSSCRAGTYSSAGASSCSSCGGNTYSAAGASSCTSCPTGQLANAGHTGCEAKKDSLAECVTQVKNKYPNVKMINNEAELTALTSVDSEEIAMLAKNITLTKNMYIYGGWNSFLVGPSYFSDISDCTDSASNVTLTIGTNVTLVIDSELYLKNFTIEGGKLAYREGYMGLYNMTFRNSTIDREKGYCISWSDCSLDCQSVKLDNTKICNSYSTCATFNRTLESGSIVACGVSSCSWSGKYEFKYPADIKCYPEQNECSINITCKSGCGDLYVGPYYIGLYDDSSAKAQEAAQYFCPDEIEGLGDYSYIIE